jgi:hypothetical protein
MLYYPLFARHRSPLTQLGKCATRVTMQLNTTKPRLRSIDKITFNADISSRALRRIQIRVDACVMFSIVWFIVIGSRLTELLINNNKVWKDTAVTYLWAPSRYLLGWTEKNYEKLQARCSVSKPRFEHRTLRILKRSANQQTAFRMHRCNVLIPCSKRFANSELNGRSQRAQYVEAQQERPTRVFGDMRPCSQLSVRYLPQAGFQFGLFFYSEDAGDIFLRLSME